MTPTTVVTEATTTVGRALNWKNVLFLLILTVVITLIMSYVLKQEVVLYDAQGNVIQKGEIKPKFKLGYKK